jgi:hypothetical protein
MAVDEEIPEEICPRASIKRASHGFCFSPLVYARTGILSALRFHFAAAIPLMDVHCSLSSH